MDVPELEFPCPYPIKVICDNGVGLGELIGGVVQKYDASFDPTSINIKQSKNGNFVSLSVTFEAKSREQLDALHQAIIATGRVKMVI